jgi:hypothetical protein
MGLPVIYRNPVLRQVVRRFKMLGKLHDRLIIAIACRLIIIAQNPFTLMQLLGSGSDFWNACLAKTQTVRRPATPERTGTPPRAPARLTQNGSNIQQNVTI